MAPAKKTAAKKTPARKAATKKAAAKKPAGMSSEHKAALAVGRTEGRAVRVYLEALEANRPKRGRKRTPESVAKRLAVVTKQIPGADPLRRLQLTQEQMDLKAELASMNDKVDLRALETGFVKAAKGYSRRKGITYAAWRQIGVSPAVLKRAGITRGS
jgi:hypothetical protein